MTGATLALSPNFEATDRSRTPTISERRLQPGWVGGVLDQLGRCMALPVGWDGYDAEPMAPAVANQVLRFFWGVSPPALRVPSILPIYRGAQLDWDACGIRVEVEFADGAVWLDLTDEAGTYEGPLDQAFPRFRQALARLSIPE